MLGLVTILIGVFIKEYVYIDYDYYIWIYLALNIVGLILIAAGFFYAIVNSNLNWFVWGAIALGLILSIIGSMLSAVYPNDFLSSCIVSIVAFFIYAIALILVLGYGPWAINLDLTLNNKFWFFPFLGLTIIIGILSVIFEGLSLPICNLCCPTNPCGKCNICKPVDLCDVDPCKPIISCTISNPCGQCNICKPVNLCNEINRCEPIISCRTSNPCGQCNICKPVDLCNEINPCEQVDRYIQVNQEIKYEQIDQQIDQYQEIKYDQPIIKVTPITLDQNKSVNLSKLANICKTIKI